MREVYGGTGVPVTLEDTGETLEKNERFDIKVNGQYDRDVRSANETIDSSIIKALNEIRSLSGEDGVYYSKDGASELYVFQGSSWHRVIHDGRGGSEFLGYAKSYAESTDTSKKYKRYKTGGLADFTGPAWLDGTPSRPEYILNAAQTERFFSLIDVLEGYDTKEKSSKSSGDNYFDININVEKIEDDYDVEQIANKIRSMIYEDATYRNVNAINHIR